MKSKLATIMNASLGIRIVDIVSDTTSSSPRIVVLVVVLVITIYVAHM